MFHRPVPIKSWFEELTEEQEREARANAESSEMLLHVFLAALALVAAFSFLMVASERGFGG